MRRDAPAARCGLLLLAAALAPLVAAAADIPVITHGQRIELGRHMVAGKYVLFDFYADWCGPCRALEPTVQALADQHRDRLAVRKVDIVDWDSEVTRQYGIRSVPHLKLFGPGGELIAQGDAGSVLAALQGRLGEALPRLSRPAERPSSPLVPVVTVAAIAAVVLVLLLGSRRRSAAPPPAAGPDHPRRPDRVDGQGPRDPSAVPIWFAVVQGSIEGPYSMHDLDRLRRSAQLNDRAQVRRKGDAEWRRLGDVLRDLPES